MTHDTNAAELKPTAYMHVMIVETGERCTPRFTIGKRHPYGVAGKDFSKEFKIETRPLYTRATLDNEKIEAIRALKVPLPCNCNNEYGRCNENAPIEAANLLIDKVLEILEQPQ